MLEQKKSAFYIINKICAFFLVIWICWPWFCQNTGLVAGLFFSAGWCCSAVCMSRKYVIGIDGLLMLGYAILMIISFLWSSKVYGNYSLLYYVPMVSLFFLPYYMCKFYADRDEKKFLGYLAIVAVIFIILGCYTSIKYTAIDENIMKTISQANDEEFVKYRKVGIGSFGFIYMLVFAFITIIGRFKCGIKELPLWLKLLLVVACGLGFSCLTLSTFTTALLLVVVGTLLVLVTNQKSAATNIFIYLLVLATVLLLGQSIGNMLVNSSFASRDVNTRMHEIGEFLLGNEAGDNISSRFDYFLRSVNCFVEYPILGYNFQLMPMAKPGSHAEWIDIFAVYGIIGGIPLLATIIIKLRRIRNIIKNKFEYPFYDVILFIFVIYGFVDPFLRLYNIGFVMFMFVPCVACIPYVFDKKEAKNENTLGYKPNNR